MFPLKRTYDRLNTQLEALLLFAENDDAAPGPKELLADYEGSYLHHHDAAEHDLVHTFDHTSQEGLFQTDDVAKEIENLGEATPIIDDADAEPSDQNEQGYLVDIIYSNREQLLRRSEAFQRREESWFNVDVNDQLQIVGLHGSASQDGWRLGDTLVGLNFQPIACLGDLHNRSLENGEEIRQRSNAKYIMRDPTSGVETPVFARVTVRRVRLQDKKPERRHWSEGTAGDLEIYRDDDGHDVRVDTMNRRYPVDRYGLRSFRIDPSTISPDFSEDDYRSLFRDAKRNKRSLADCLEEVRALRRKRAAPEHLSAVPRWEILEPQSVPTSSQTAPVSAPADEDGGDSGDEPPPLIAVSDPPDPPVRSAAASASPHIEPVTRTWARDDVDPIPPWYTQLYAGSALYGWLAVDRYLLDPRAAAQPTNWSDEPLLFTNSTDAASTRFWENKHYAIPSYAMHRRVVFQSITGCHPATQEVYYMMRDAPFAT